MGNFTVKKICKTIASSLAKNCTSRAATFIQFFQGSCLDNFVSNVALFAHIRTHTNTTNTH